MKTFRSRQPFLLESGFQLPELEIAYHTYGQLAEEKGNVIWVCHALTANSNVAEWWPGIMGENLVLDPAKHFIICANILGSCYGTTGPLSINPDKGAPYFDAFPLVTIRDIVRAHQLLAHHLGIQKIHLLMGGSMGGYQVLEWAAMEPDFIDRLFVIATSASETAWGIGIHTSQRLAIEADATWGDQSAKAAQKGLKAARAFGMITYRSYVNYAKSQTDPVIEKLDDFKASSYINYQGQKLVDRFNSYSYWTLTKAMDAHNIARGRAGSVTDVLKQMKQDSLVIGITTDMLCPVTEQKQIADNMPHANFVEIDSIYGHDGFLVETAKISQHLENWLTEKISNESSYFKSNQETDR